MWCSAHDDRERRIAPLELTRRLDERIEVARDLLRAAAREQRQEPLALADTQRPPCLGAVRQCPGAIQERMPDERRVDAVLSQERFLEREDHSCLRDRAGKLAQPLGAPRPHLRRDVVQHGDRGCARRGSDLHVESWIVDQHDEGDAATSDAALELSRQPIVQRDVLEHLDESHDGETLGVLE